MGRVTWHETRILKSEMVRLLNENIDEHTFIDLRLDPSNAGRP